MYKQVVNTLENFIVYMLNITVSLFPMCLATQIPADNHYFP